jgi:hypothetical protein
MNSIELRNQKLAELRAQKSRGLRKSAILNTEVGLNPDRMKSNPEAVLEVTLESPKNQDYSLKTQDLPQEPMPKPETEDRPEPIPSIQSKKSPDTRLDQLKHQYDHKKFTSDKNQSEIQDLQRIIQCKKQNISNALSLINGYNKEKQEIYPEIQAILEKQALIRRKYNEKVKNI